MGHIAYEDWLGKKAQRNTLYGEWCRYILNNLNDLTGFALLYEMQDRLDQAYNDLTNDIIETDEHKEFMLCMQDFKKSGLNKLNAGIASEEDLERMKSKAKAVSRAITNLCHMIMDS